MNNWITFRKSLPSFSQNLKNLHINIVTKFDVIHSFGDTSRTCAHLLVSTRLLVGLFIISASKTLKISFLFLELFCWEVLICSLLLYTLTSSMSSNTEYRHCRSFAVLSVFVFATNVRRPFSLSIYFCLNSFHLKSGDDIFHSLFGIGVYRLLNAYQTPSEQWIAWHKTHEFEKWGRQGVWRYSQIDIWIYGHYFYCKVLQQ